MMKQIDGFNLGTLTTYYRESPAFKAIVEHLYGCAKEPRNGESKAGNLQQALLAKGKDLSLYSIREALEKMAKAGCGDYQAGRPVEESRLVWNQSAKGVAASVMGRRTCDDLVQPIAASSSLPDDGTNIELTHPEVNCSTHYFPLAANENMPVKIPSSFDAKQVHHLADFLHVVANSMAN